jgi:hypothetical protein
MFTTLAVATPALSGGGLTPPVEYLTNGNFETGDRSGWAESNTASCSWRTNDGSQDPSGPGVPVPPIQGNFDQFTNQTGGSRCRLAQTIVVPVDVGLATLSWSDRIRNFAGGFADPLQEWRVIARTSGGLFLQEIFSTNPGDPPIQIGPNARAFDVTALLQSREGLQTRFSWEQQAFFFFFNATLDVASLTIQLLDEDDDGVTDSFDLCPGTSIPEAVVPSNGEVLVNHFALFDGDTMFDTTEPFGEGPGNSYDTADTLGCSCEQIIAEQGLGQGHVKHGCSIEVMDDWVALVNP